MKAAREAWFEAKLDLDSDKLILLDETAAATNMARRYGYAPHGERYRLLVPPGHDKTTTVTTALRITGAVRSLPSRLSHQWSALPQLHRQPLRPGDTLILDNLQAHKISGIRNAYRDGPPRVQPDRVNLREAESAAANRTMRGF